MISEVYRLLFLGDSDMFVFDKRKRCNTLNPVYLTRLREFNKLKVFVISTAEPNTELIDLKVLKQFIE